MDASYLSSLNEQQRLAATAPVESPVLIIAGAGTGKTNTLAHRVAHLIHSGLDPGRALLLTFTRRAAHEMTRRAQGILENSARGAEGSRGGIPGSAEGKDEGGRRKDGTEGRRGPGAVGTAAVSRIWSGTFHAVSNRLLRMYARGLGMAENFTVIDRSDAEDLLNVCRSELGLDKGDVRFPRKGTCLAIYSRCVNAQEPIDAALKKYFPWCQDYPEQLRLLFKTYTQRKLEHNILDYDDLLLYWHHAMQDENVAQAMRNRFDAVLVDEYQDTNALQAAILKSLCPQGRGLTVVGDDAQSIYAFRAATVHNILQFPQEFPGTLVLKLEQNYRSVQPILDATNAVIAQCARRYNKDLFSYRSSEQKPRLVSVLDEDQQCAYVIGQILQHVEAGIPLKRQAVLFRTAHHSDALEVELSRRNIPFVKYGGLKFLEAAHVKDALGFLRLAENPRDATSAFRVLQLMDGFGPSHAKRALEHLATRGFELAAWSDFRPPAASSAQWREFVALLLELSGVVPDAAGQWLADAQEGSEEGTRARKHEGTEGMNPPRTPGGNGQRATGNSVYSAIQNPQSTIPVPLPDQVAAIRRFYTPILEKRYDQAPVRARDLEQLQQIASNFRTRSQLLSDLTLDPPASTQDLAGPPLMEEDYLILSTIHSAKGCEWDAVYVIHAADGNIPSDMSTGSEEQIEEERRLFYVALTRAKDFLDVIVPLKYYHKKGKLSDRHSYAQITRFVPESIIAHFERHSLEPRLELALTPAAVRAQSDLKKKIVAMWG